MQPVENVPMPPGPSETFVDDDLVVNLSDLPLVTRVLDGLQIRWSTDLVEQEPTLGLAKLTGLQGLTGRASLVRAYHSAEISRMEGESGRKFTELDTVLFGLRRYFAETFGGWVPELAKNRDVGPVLPQPGGAHKSMAVDAPRSLDHVPMSDVAVTAGAGVRIGVLDTPLFPNAALAGTIELTDGGQWNPDAPLVWKPWQGHATFVASRILERAPSATLVMRPALTSDTEPLSVWELARAMVRIAAPDDLDDLPPIQILNLSIGCRTADGRPPLVLARAVRALRSDVLVVAAAGNHRETEHAAAPIWPAALSDVVAVTATAEPESPGTPGSGFAANLPWITCAAPGVRVPGAFIIGDVLVPSDTADPFALTVPPPVPVPFTGAALWSGTSFAAATVSGAVAARMTGGLTARKALDALLADPAPDAVVRRYVYPAPR